jgi:hypothetical protein
LAFNFLKNWQHQRELWRFVIPFAPAAPQKALLIIKIVTSLLKIKELLTKDLRLHA